MTTEERGESLAGGDALEDAGLETLAASLSASDPTERQQAVRAAERLGERDADRATEPHRSDADECAGTVRGVLVLR